MIDRKHIFNEVRTLIGRGFKPEEVARLDAAIDRAEGAVRTSELTAKTVCYALHEEGFVKEAYKDSVGVWTAFGGVTNASGHEVYPRYKDNPQTIEKGLEVTIWLMKERYLPPVLKAFDRYPLQEHQLAAALSFHWNTGAIGKTDWVRLVTQGRMADARTFLEKHYLNGGALEARRKREASLFFDGIWPSDLKVPVYPVSKPSYSPAWGKAEKVDFMPIVENMV